MVAPLVREDVGEPAVKDINSYIETGITPRNLLRDQGRSKANGHCGSKYKPIPASEGTGRNNTDTRDCDGAEQEGCHAPEYSTWNGDEGCSELAEDTHDEQPEAAGVASFAVGAASKRNHTVVLREGGHRSDRAETCDNAVQTVCKHAALDPAVEELAIDFEARDIASSRDITNCFHCEDNVDSQQW